MTARFLSFVSFTSACLVASAVGACSSSTLTPAPDASTDVPDTGISAPDGSAPIDLDGGSREASALDAAKRGDGVWWAPLRP